MLVRENKRIEFEKEEASIETGALGAAVLLGMTKDGKQVKEHQQLTALAVTALDLAVAQSCLLLYAPSELWRTTPLTKNRWRIRIRRGRNADQ